MLASLFGDEINGVVSDLANVHDQAMNSRVLHRGPGHATARY